MKSISKVIILALVVFLAVSAFAAGSSNITITKDVTVSGTKLTPGEYKVSVDGTGSDVKVTFAQGKKVVATATGKMVEGQVAPEFSAVVTENVNGTFQVTELRVAKMKGAVSFAK